MGYALGRIEDLTPTPFLHIVSAETRPPDYTGHLASIAVHSRFRGFGVAQSLMRRMHFNMVEYYGVDKVNLLCRVSLFFLPAITEVYACGTHRTVPIMIKPCCAGVQQGGY